MVIFAWVIVLTLLAYFFHFWDEKQNRTQQAQIVVTEGMTETILKRNADNQYVTEGKINGKPVILLLDTGANHVVVPENLAKELGLVRGPKGIAHTAGGSVQIYQTRINKLVIGHITLHNVVGMINPQMRGRYVLLGMSVLKRIDFTQRKDELILTVPK